MRRRSVAMVMSAMAVFATAVFADGVNGPVTQATSTPADVRDDEAFIGQVREAVSAAPLRRVSSASDTRVGPFDCDERMTKDPLDDGVFDIVGTRMESSCQVANAFAVRFTRRADRLDEVLVLVELDIDRNRRTGCGGTDRLLAISLFVEQFGRKVAYDLPSCRQSTWHELEYSAFDILFDDRTVVFELRSAAVDLDRPFNWFAGSYPEGKDEGSDQSPDSGWATSYFPPTRVEKLTLEGHGPAVTLRWSRANGRGAPIQRYRIRYGPSGSPSRSITRPATSRQVRIANLEVGQAYVFSVVAVNAAGQSRDLNPEIVEYAPYVRPLAPIDLAVTERLGVAGAYDLTWNYPINNSGRILRGAILTVTPLGGEPVVTRHPVNPRRIELPDLEPGSTYRISLQSTHLLTSAKSSIEFEVPVPPPG